MANSPLEKTIESGISFPTKVFPLKTYLYSPLFNGPLFWTIRKTHEGKKER